MFPWIRHGGGEGAVLSLSSHSPPPEDHFEDGWHALSPSYSIPSLPLHRCWNAKHTVLTLEGLEEWVCVCVCPCQSRFSVSRPAVFWKQHVKVWPVQQGQWEEESAKISRTYLSVAIGLALNVGGYTLNVCHIRMNANCYHMRKMADKWGETRQWLQGLM